MSKPKRHLLEYLEVVNFSFRNAYAHELFLHSNFMVDMAMHSIIYQRA